ncbi:NAD(P)/FAD-dependent oxidoreductase [Pseudactinotalea suaedae]|uniref:NAD(P)/FAD-dependent oxidoreductase n=1 Tax=Pseudactinotalea suaedae TaxID=1524924 RepID=UPI001F4F6D3B|nr:FAD-dependent oxidoreductase [Pseudactinotalea suaedae]
MRAAAPQGVPDRVIVVGGGLAGLRTLAELRGLGFDGELVWVGAETTPAYDRPPLSKELLSRPEPLWLAEDLGHQHTELADAVHLGRAATGLRRDGGALIVSTDAGELAADAVVAATGSEPVRPWPDAVALHSAADATHLREQVRPGRHVVIIGAGWIGAEVAGVAAGAGIRVTVLEAGSAPLWRQLGEVAGERTREWYTTAGVELRTDVIVTEVDGGTVTLDDGSTVTGDIVLSAVGVRPATGWLDGVVPTLASGHVVTDRAGATAAPGVWAVGDIAMRETLHFGAVPGGHWFAALRDPALVAADILGLPLPPAEAAPEVFSDQLGHHLEVFGRLVRDGEPGAARVLRTLDGGWSELHVSDQRLVGAVVVDAPREVAAVRKLLRGEALPRLDLALAGDPAVALRAATLP